MESSDKGIVENPDAGLRSVGLTSREIQILRQLALGKGDKEISIDLLISVKTVNHHVSNIILKLDAKNPDACGCKGAASPTDRNASQRCPEQDVQQAPGRQNGSGSID